jgi:hypothetical protein
VEKIGHRTDVSKPKAAGKKKAPVRGRSGRSVTGTKRK